MILGITPARGGSKGIPRKNIKPFCGKPLIAWTIEQAKKSKLLNKYLVSTDDIDIYETSLRYGTNCIDRDPKLARDDTSTIAVLQDVLERIGNNVDTVVLLQCTSPIRNDGLIDRCIERFFESGADSLATGLICKNYEYGKNSQRRQDKKGWFYDDGNVYVFKANLIRKGERYGNKIEKMIISREENLEIDDEFDFWIAEQVMGRRQ